MGTSILAGQQLRLQWDDQAKDFKPAGAKNGAAVFTVISLDYFTAQAVMSHETDDQKVRACIEAGLHSVEGGDCDAEAWKQAPRAVMVNPLFHAIWQHTWGN